MTLHRYFARRFIMSFLGVMLAIFIVMTLIDMVEQIQRFSSVSVSFDRIFALTLLNVPRALYAVLPLIVILASIALFVALSRSSEMVISRAAGRSAVTSVAAPAIVALMIGVLGVAVMNPIVAATSRQYEKLTDSLLGQVSSVLSVGPEGLWMREGDADGQTVIRAARANFDGTALSNVTFLDFTPDGVPNRRIEARQARLGPGVWEMEEAKVWDIEGSANPEAEAQLFPVFRVETGLTPEEIADSFGAPSAIPIWELPAFIDRLEEAGFSARHHRVWLQMELAMPMFLAAMVMVAACFTLRPARFGQTGLMVVMALMLGFSLYFVRNFAQILGENGQIPATLAAWGPPAATMLLPLGLLLHLEDG